MIESVLSPWYAHYIRQNPIYNSTSPPLVKCGWAYEWWFIAGEIIYKSGIFHCNVWLPEGKSQKKNARKITIIVHGWFQWTSIRVMESCSHSMFWGRKMMLVAQTCPPFQPWDSLGSTSWRNFWRVEPPAKDWNHVGNITFTGNMLSNPLTNYH